MRIIKSYFIVVCTEQQVVAARNASTGAVASEVGEGAGRKRGRGRGRKELRMNSLIVGSEVRERESG